MNPQASLRERAAQRREQYAALRRSGLGKWEAARRLEESVSDQTVSRYERWYRATEGLPLADPAAQAAQNRLALRQWGRT